MISRTPSKFRIGVLALFMSSPPILIGAMVVIEIPSTLSSGCSGVYDGYLEYAQTACFVGAAVAFLGLFQRDGRIAAIAALGIYLIETIVYPGLIVCH